MVRKDPYPVKSYHNNIRPREELVLTCLSFLDYYHFIMPEKESKATIKIPRALYRRLSAIIDESGFDSVTDFIVYVLRDIASSIDHRELSRTPDSDPIRLTAREVEKVRQRLKNLGYL
jgi:hypothetical protein